MRYFVSIGRSHAQRKKKKKREREGGRGNRNVLSILGIPPPGIRAILGISDGRDTPEDVAVVARDACRAGEAVGCCGRVAGHDGGVVVLVAVDTEEEQ